MPGTCPTGDRSYLIRVPLDPLLAAETERLLVRFETEPEHTEHVARLALQLFDQLLDWHQLTLRDRDLLEVAAVLHDIGWSQCQPDGRAHHKATAQLIRAHPWQGLSPSEVECVAEVARYHRKSLPDLTRHASFARLPEEDRHRVVQLAAFLRIADGLDRRHIQRVRRISASFAPEGLIVLAYAPGEIETELAAADKKSDLLRRLIRLGPTFAARLELSST